MRILHILDHSLPLMSGYTFRTRAILKSGERNGWTVAGVTGFRHSAGEGRGGKENVDGLDFYRTPGVASGRAPFREWKEIQALADRVVEAAAEFKPDLLHAHSPVLNGLAGLSAARRLNLPLLYEIRAFWEDAAVGNGTGSEGSARYLLTRWAESYVVRKADKVAVICDGLKGDLVSRGVDPAKIMVSPNGVDLDLFGNPPPREDALGTKAGIGGDDEVIGFIGSYYDYEGLDILLAAMPALVRRRPKLRLLMVGGGPMEEALKAQAAASPTADRIHFIGRVPHDEVEGWYSLIDVLVYPRKSMRLTDLVTPLKPLEAMAQGKLVAASDVGGHRELIEDGKTGTLFLADDPSALADSVADLLENRAIWDERRRIAKDYVRKDRNWSSNILRYDPVYRELTGNTGK